MEQDPRFKYLMEMRNQLLKEGSTGEVSFSMKLGHFDSRMLFSVPRPPHATGFFVGDTYGGSGWMASLKDGSTERFYVEFPEEVQKAMNLQTAARFAEKTTQGSVEAPADTVNVLLTDYVAYLAKLVEAAQREFGHK
jgi:hypothetical protein